MAGNDRFVQGAPTGDHGIVERRREAAAAQMPPAMVLTCSDSRVPAERVFDQSVGSLFVCRVVGHVLQPAIVGSLEYAVSRFGSSLLVVLGHQRCGAIQDSIAVVESGGVAPGSMESIVDAIRPAIAETPRGGLAPDEYVDAVVRANVRRVAGSLREASGILAAAAGAARLQIVPAHYSLDSGLVEVLA
jgi:carbonic anhydrase